MKGVTEQRLVLRMGRNVHPAAVRDQGPTGTGPGDADEALAAVPVGETDGTGDTSMLRNSQVPVAGTKTRRPLFLFGGCS